MKPNHTKEQRAGLFAIARLLDRVPRSKFNMKFWVIDKSDGEYQYGLHHLPTECGFAGCALGWAMTLPRFKRHAGYPFALASELGLNPHGDKSLTAAGTSLFGGWREKATPKRVANDIRRYLKDGTLPQRPYENG